jgi:hypothetical protein
MYRGDTADLCCDADKDTDQLWEWVTIRLENLTNRFDDMATCMPTSGAASCQTSKAAGAAMTNSNPLPHDGPAKVVQSGYPSLITGAEKLARPRSVLNLGCITSEDPHRHSLWPQRTRARLPGCHRTPTGQFGRHIFVSRATNVCRLAA